MVFAGWLEEEYIKWRNRQLAGEPDRITDFAQHLGITDADYQKYKTGSIPGTVKLDSIGAKLGPLTYVKANRPDPLLRRFIAIWQRFSEEQKVAFVEQAEAGVQAGENERPVGEVHNGVGKTKREAAA